MARWLMVFGTRIRLLALAGIGLLALVALSEGGGRSALAGRVLPEDLSAQELAALLTVETKLTASDAAAGDLFGFSVAIDGDTAVVGAYGDNFGQASGQGSAYVFERRAGAWIEVAKLTASDAAGGDRFGWSVAISGDRAIVGAPFNGDGADAINVGSAYVFERDAGGPDAWDQVASLNAGDAAAGDFFGSSVAISGDRAVVGAPGDDSSGSAYLFERDAGGGWHAAGKLRASDAAAADAFGGSVAIGVDTVVAGAWGDDNQQGAAYVFERDAGSGSWNQVDKLIASDAAAGDLFGTSVALSGDIVVVGANLNDHDGGANAGAAYIFGRNGGPPVAWDEVTRLTASDAGPGDLFGRSVAISGDRALVGATGDDSNSGSAYLFERDTGGTGAWSEEGKVTASDAAALDLFGASVGISGDAVIVGAHGDTHAGGTGAGSAYVFQILPDPEPDGLLFSLQNGSLAIPDVGTVRDEDVVRWDAEDGYSLFWDGSDHGIGANVDAFALLPDGRIVISLASNATVPDVGVVSSADLLAWSEEGGWELWFDASDIGLTTSSENLDAVDLQGETLAASTSGAFTLSGGQHGLDEDLFLCRPVVPELEGGTICADPALWDGSDAGLGAASEDVSGLSVLGSTSYLTTSGNWTLGVLSGANEDVIACQTNCVPATVYFDGTDNGLPASATLDAIHVPALE